MKIELGHRVKDKVTGFIGIAVCKCLYLNGCIQYDVRPPVDDKGATVKGLWVDEAQLEFVDHGVLPLVESDEDKPSGGHRDHPQ